MQYKVYYLANGLLIGVEKKSNLIKNKPYFLRKIICQVEDECLTFSNAPYQTKAMITLLSN